MTAAYDIATEHAILAEASAAGNLRAVPAALLFGVLLAAFYDLFRMLYFALGVREDACSDGGRLRKWILALRQYRCRVLPRRKQAVGGDEDGRNKRSHHRLPARVVQAMLDILYFLLCGVLGAVFLYWQNSGILRWYLILGGAIGFFVYSRSLGRWMLPLFQLGISVIRAGMCALYNGILYYPVYMIDRVLYGMGLLCKKAGNAVVRTIQRRRCRRRIRKILCTEEPVQKKRRPRRQKAKE